MYNEYYKRCFMTCTIKPYKVTHVYGTVNHGQFVVIDSGQ